MWSCSRTNTFYRIGINARAVLGGEDVCPTASSAHTPERGGFGWVEIMVRQGIITCGICMVPEIISLRYNIVTKPST
jgi:hypothetical protein